MTDRREFDEALAEYRATYAAFMAFGEDGAISLTGTERDQACNEACRINNDAWDKLISTAAPDLAGIVTKMQAFRQQYADHEADMDELAIICAEAARLTEEGKTASTWDATYASWKAANNAYQSDDDTDQGRASALADAEDRYLTALMACPAPTGEALAAKLELYFDREMGCWGRAETDIHPRLISDAKALVGRGVA